MGNYGVNEEDVESERIQVNGFVVKEAFFRYSNPRAKKSLHEYLAEHGVVGIYGVDTRALVKKIREKGTMKGVISTEGSPEELVREARSLPDISRLNLVEEVATRRIYYWGKEGRREVPPEGEGPLVAVVDFGVKFNILRLLAKEGARVVVVPPFFAKEAIKKLNPDALFLSNGPGDPERVVEGIRLAREYLGKKPLMGICLGCQILGLALGGKTYKLNRTPRSQPSRKRLKDGKGGDYRPKPQLRHRPRQSALRGGGYPPEPTRRYRRGHKVRGRTLCSSIPPRKLAGSPRLLLSL